MSAGIGKTVPVQHDGRAELTAVGHLDYRRKARHDYGDGDVQQASMISNGERMIAGRCGNSSAPSCFWRKQLQGISRTAFLEAACALEIFQLAENLGAADVRKRNRFNTRTFKDTAGDATPRCEDVF